MDDLETCGCTNNIDTAEWKRGQFRYWPLFTFTLFGLPSLKKVNFWHDNGAVCFWHDSPSKVAPRSKEF